MAAKAQSMRRIMGLSREKLFGISFMVAADQAIRKQS
jgi:hypothetical protein